MKEIHTRPLGEQVLAHNLTAEVKAAKLKDFRLGMIDKTLQASIIILVMGLMASALSSKESELKLTTAAAIFVLGTLPVLCRFDDYAAPITPRHLRYYGLFHELNVSPSFHEDIKKIRFALI